MAFELIEEIIVTTTSGVIALEFANIPQDGTDLLLMCSGRNRTVNGSLLLKLNDNAAGYMGNRFRASGTSLSAFESGYQIGNPRSATNSFGAFKVILKDYTLSGTGSQTQFMYETGQITPNSTGQVQLGSGNYNYTDDPITNVQLIDSEDGWAQHTVASLYKITAS